MTDWLKSRKRAAAFVMIAGLATLLGSWGITQAGEKVRTGSGWECDAMDLERVALPLELADDAAEVGAVLGAAPEPCVREAGRAMVARDWFLIPSYGFLVAAMLLMLASLRLSSSGQWWAGLGAGAVLAAVAMAADVVENLLLLRLLAPPGAPAPALDSTLAALRAATTAKWGALAVAAAVAAILWVWRPRWPVNAPPEASATARTQWIARAGLLASWLAAALGMGAAVVLLWALIQQDDAAATESLLLGGLLLVLFWACAFARAVGIAAEPLARLAVADTPPQETAEAACAPPPGVAPNPGSSHERAYPRSLFAREWRLLCDRRAQAGQPPDGPRVGFGLSGGGIRSATVDLGLFQGLSELAAAEPPPPPERRVLERIDFVSTVSGGGYFGSFLGRLWNRRFVGGPRDVAAVLRGIGENGRNVLRYLRENGRYLSPNGAGDLLLGGAVVLRNWVAVQLVLLSFLLTVFLGLQTARPELDRLADLLPQSLGTYFDLAGASFWWSPWLILPVIVFGLVVFPIGWAYWMVESVGRAFAGAGERSSGVTAPRSLRWDQSAIAPLAGLLLTFVVAVIMIGAVQRPAPRAVWLLVALTAALTYGWYRLARRLALRKAQHAERSEEDADTGGLSGGRPTLAERQIGSRIHAQADQRHRLSLWLVGALGVTAVLLVLGIIDSVGQSLYLLLLGPDPFSGWLVGVFSALGGLGSVAHRIAAFTSRGSGDKRPSLPLNLIAGLAALLLVTLILVCLNAASHAVAWRMGAPVDSLQWRQAQRDCVTVASGRNLCSPAELSRRETGEGLTLPFRERRDWQFAGISLLAGFVLSVMFGQTFPFVNRSSHHSLYSARLTRAYLGASNQRRWKESVTRVIRGDDIDLMRYWPPPAAKAAPVHLVNVTVNETVGGRSQIEQKDRKGTNLALGPHGLSVGVEHHAVIPLGSADPVGRQVTVLPEEEGTFRVFEYPRLGAGGPRVFTGESLTLGEWVGISGAAFSTGLGARTSLGLSVLAGFGNVRLGRWWDSGVEVGERSEQVKPSRLVALEQFAARLFPVQVFLLDEFLARFHGTARRHWYLSDGGHFENLAGYELVRRRLPMIVLVDAEEDVDFAFGGLSNLIRKARIDFGAEIEFLDARALASEIDASMRGVIGTLEDLRRGTFEDGPTAEEPERPWRLVTPDQTGFSRAHAALARITYADEPQRTTRLLYIKATLTGDEPADVLEYHRAHPAFPHESTADQFFDEAQWESYRRLGEHIGLMVFRRPAPAGEQTGESAERYWWPDDLV